MGKFLELMESWEGFVPVNSVQLDEAAMAKALDLITNKAGVPSWRHEFMLREAVTTSEFPYLFGQILDRQILARYKAAVADWRSYCKVSTVPDFRPVTREKVYGQDSILPEVAEKGEYLVSQSGNARYQLQVKKYGRQFDISWEAIVNDVMNAFADIPDRFATAAIRTEAYHVTCLYASATGPNTNLFGAPITDVDGQAVTNLGNLPLTIANLETTLALMAQQTDPSGEPILVRGVHLVVPPALEFTARQILTSGLKMWTESAGGAATPYPTTNVIPQMGLKLHVDPYLPIVDQSAKKNTTWYLFADPAEGAAIEMAFLRGHETPEICMKASDKVSVGGAALSPFSGDFATDNIFYRIRVVHGGTQLDPRYAYAQTGS